MKDGRLVYDYHCDTGFAVDRFPYKYNKPLEIVLGTSKLSGLYGQSRPKLMWEDIRPVSHTSLGIMLKHENNVIAHLTMNEIRINGASEDMFRESMDSHSGPYYNMAMFLIENWYVDELKPYGHVVELERISIAPDYRGQGLLEAMVDWVFANVYRKRSLFILKAFALQYEGAGDLAETPIADAAHARLAAHYAKIFDMKAPSDPAAQYGEGWLYRVEHPACEPV